MELVDSNGQKLNAEKKIVDASGEQISSQPEQPLTTEQIGEMLANHMITGALKFPTDDLVNKQFDIIFHAALHIISHRILNIGLGFDKEGVIIPEWDNSRASAAEKTAQEQLSETITLWKEKFFNGEMNYHAGKSK
jgi:hypothetical protein